MTEGLRLEQMSQPETDIELQAFNPNSVIPNLSDVYHYQQS